MLDILKKIPMFAMFNAKEEQSNLIVKVFFCAYNLAFAKSKIWLSNSDYDYLTIMFSSSSLARTEGDSLSLFYKFLKISL